MRNKYPGVCFKCGKNVVVGAGHFEAPTSRRKQWRVQCAEHSRKIDPKQLSVPKELRNKKF